MGRTGVGQEGMREREREKRKDYGGKRKGRKRRRGRARDRKIIKILPGLGRDGAVGRSGAGPGR